MGKTWLGTRNLFLLLKPIKQQCGSAAAFRHLCSESGQTASPPAQSNTSTSSAIKAVSLQTVKPDFIVLKHQILSLLHSKNAEDWASNGELQQLLPAIPPLGVLEVIRELGSYRRSFEFFNFFKNIQVHESSTLPSSKAVSFAFEGVLEHASREEGSNAHVKLQELFNFAREQNVVLSVMSSILLIKCFGQAKMFEQAVAVFNAVEPGSRNASLVNSVLSSMLMEGRVDDALKLIDETLESKVVRFPTYATMEIVLSYALTVNCSGRSLREEEIYKMVMMFSEHGLFPSRIWLCQIITMFCRHGKRDQAWDLVHHLMRLGGVVDTAACNALMTGLLKGHDFQRMNLLMKEMKEKNIQPNVVTFGILINHLCKLRRVDEAIKVFEQMKDNAETGGISVEPDAVLYSTLIDGLCKVGRLDEALVFLEKLKSQRGCRPIPSSYNALIDGFCKVGEIERSLELFSEMINEGVEPNVITYNTLLDGMSRCGRVSTAFRLFNEMQGKGIKGDAATFTILITAFCNVKNIDRAMELFDQMLESGIASDATLYHSLISGLSQAGKMDDACSVVSQMRAAGFQLDLIGYNILISGFCKKNKLDKAYELFESMGNLPVNPDRVTYNTLIAHSSQKGDFETAHTLWKKMVMDKITPDVITYGSLISAYCKLGNMDEAMKIFKEMNSGRKTFTKKPNTIIYNTLIHAHCKSDSIETALSLLGDMKNEGVKPNTSTFNSLLKAFQERHWLDKALKLLDEMKKQSCNPDHVTMEILTEWLPSVGQTEKLQAFVQAYEVSSSSSASASAA